MNVTVTISGETLESTIEEIANANDWGPDDVDIVIRSMKATGEYRGGGGASPEFTITKRPEGQERK